MPDKPAKPVERSFELTVYWEEFRMGSWLLSCSRQFFELERDQHGAYLEALNNNGHIDPADETKRNVTIERRYRGVLVTNEKLMGDLGRLGLTEAFKLLAGKKTPFRSDEGIK